METSPKVLSKDQLNNIHEASISLLTKIGYFVPVQEARQLLLAAGARFEGERVFIPEKLVDQALNNMRQAKLFNRSGDPVNVLTQGKVTFGTNVDTIYIMDPYKRSIRPFLKNDEAWLTSVVDALPNLDYVQCLGQAHDVPETLQSQVAVLQSLRNTSKPILVFPYNRQGLVDILDIVYVVSGGEKNFRKKPFLMCASVPAAPLYGTDYNIELLLACAEREVPLLSYSCPSIGCNSPCNLASTLSLANADWLANLVIHQLKRPGAPFCTAGFTVQLMDMRTTLWSYCAPEMMMAYTAVNDLAHWYGLPTWGLEMTCDTPWIDAQAGVEMMAQCQRAIISGYEVIHNAGIMGAGKLCCAEAVILADEIIGYTRASLKPVSVNAIELEEGLQLITEVGIPGEFVTHDHTLKHFREFWYPKIFDRGMYDPQGKGLGPDLVDRLNNRARNIIEKHQPSRLPDDVQLELEEIEANWFARE